MFIKKIEEVMGVEVIGVVNEDKRFKESLKRRVPLIHMFPYSKSAEQIEKIVEKITGEKFYTKKSFVGKLLARVNLI